MSALVKNLQAKNYNPCGTLTGRENNICDSARKSFFNLPYVQVMRNIVIAEIGSFKPTEKFANESALIDWSKRDLNSEELKAAFDFNSVEFESFSPLEVGLCKYFVHILFENRYNIFYNRLIDYCNELDEKIFDNAEKNNLTSEMLEKKINSLAGEGDYSQTFNNLTDEFLNFVMGFAA